MCVAGWFRQCSVIPYSKDVDIGIWIKEYNDQLISSMQNNGLELIHRFGKVRFLIETKLDLFLVNVMKDINSSSAVTVVLCYFKVKFIPCYKLQLQSVKLSLSY